MAKKQKNWVTGPGVNNDVDIAALKSEVRMLSVRLSTLEDSYSIMFNVLIDVISGLGARGTSKTTKKKRGK